MFRAIFDQSFTAHAENNHFSTFGQIFNYRFEIFVVRFLFDYEICWHLPQDLCVFGAKTAFVMQNSDNLGVRGRDTHFRLRLPEGTCSADSARFEPLVF